MDEDEKQETKHSSKYEYSNINTWDIMYIEKKKNYRTDYVKPIHFEVQILKFKTYLKQNTSDTS